VSAAVEAIAAKACAPLADCLCLVPRACVRDPSRRRRRRLQGGYTRKLGPCSAKDPVMGVTCMTGEAGASNHPLRGGKYSFLEGGWADE
jgi:hypothetical protein